MIKFFKEINRSLTFIKCRIKKFWIGMIGMTTVTASQAVVHSIAIKLIIDASISHNIDFLQKAIFLIVIGMVVIMVLIPQFHRMFNFSAKEGQADTQMAVFTHRGSVPVSYFEKNHSGTLFSSVFNDSHAMYSLYTGKLRRIISPIIHSIFCIIPMYIFSWQIATVLIFVNILSASVNLLFSKPIREESGKVLKNISKVTEELINLVGGIKTHKMFNSGSTAMDRFSSKNDIYTDSAIKRDDLSALLESINYFIGLTVNLGIIGGGLLLVSKGYTTLGSLLAIIQLQRRLNQAFLDVGVVFPLIQQSLAGTERLFNFFDVKKEPEFYKNCEKGDLLNYIELRDVSFSYSKDKEILKGINLKAKRGEIIALVGDSGGGKSTIMKLLLGLYPTDSGSINIGGKSIGADPLVDIRDITAYVPQDAYLYDGTIEDNIRLGRKDATMEEIIEAAKLANAHNFILELTDGYKTEIGERGLKISGGQRQRLAIARAIIKDSPILLLDEATSSLDSESEQLIQDSLDQLMKNKTSVVIAHRLSTILHADRIYVLDQGRVVEVGTHSKLLEENGYYANLYNKSFVS